LKLVLVAAALAACAKVMPPGNPTNGEGAPSAVASASEAPPPDASAPEASAPGDVAAPVAPSAAPGAASASAKATPSASAAPTASGSSPPVAPTASAAPAPRPVTITIADPKFTSGEAPKAKAAFEKLRGKLEKCVDDHGGLSGESGEIVVQFLVRLEGIAEGVDVLRAKGVSPDAKNCVRDLIKKRSVGAPTSDPTGVELTLTLAPRRSSDSPSVK
jgi:hypothetical protein